MLDPVAGSDCWNARKRNRTDRSTGRIVPFKRIAYRNQPTRRDNERMPAAMHLPESCQTIEAVDMYFNLRVVGRLRISNDPGRYQGLKPSSKVLLTRNGYKFHLNTKLRVNWAGEPIDYLACDSLQSHVTKLYRDAGIRGGSSHSGRRTMASLFIQQGESVETVQLLLEHAEIDHVRPYLHVSQKRLEVMFESAF